MHKIHSTIEGESQSVAHERCEPDFVTELRVVCAIAGQCGIRLASHLVSFRSFETSNEI